ncbi:adenosylmethionine--8-amino-7-oxononanoate transaminase [Gordonia amarae]|uniref:Adenosylmethionine-8-amino-7-oxononanoate aminotransferase n=3 Tax=Gordonia amarae TaxID=36821 RepID=A0A857KLJ4_9ACTN|nr:adenosylmethionine--8-amino-7-oxononanoate transaminase [Gordonia amarae]MCS3879526.1 adenosylmethionine-8-amino-7-oxononanoate aminotransferase [Gordonia amarae]QHN17995.1 adenosylmethionine--8-amino-7-oxononanoate transaminase [Gordonia amarae]QHN22515.1 adenosylmethionine--8-amino-7-oxononanoate transaminase [Gordonia amarae]QHN31380.1 adenosylmethionine--8-amino-7-oxononanoate transaminase [Gordonia amarae]QHN40126.1 adenosylmethionine--8-amino-7-oxononanoate transaminase [Gordonia amar
MDEATISRIDAEHIWHPYGAMPAPSEPIVVDGAQGVRLQLADGRTVVDGMSSWWAAIHGYRHPVLDAAVTAQLGSMAHVMFGGLTHRPAAELARRLVDLTPAGLERVFFCDSGSVSVEVAAKMAIQYWRSRGRGERTRLLTWRGGYHGDTLTPMSVCDPDGGMHAMWRSVLPSQIFVPEPPAIGAGDAALEAYVALLDDAIGSHADELAAVIVEPVVQGAGGMRFHDPRLLRRLRELCDAHEVLLIFDEIATGFGRTGELFAADHARVAPDIMCVGKALTGGYLTLAATLCTPRIAETISAGEAGGLAHGPTFMANPLACAVAVASIDLLLDSPWRENIARISSGLAAGLEPLREAPGVRDVRVFGAIGVVQLNEPVDMAVTTRAAVDAGVWLRPFRDLIYTMPPFLCTDDDIATICAGITAAATARHRLVSLSQGENR